MDIFTVSTPTTRVTIILCYTLLRAHVFFFPYNSAEIIMSEVEFIQEKLFIGNAIIYYSLTHFYCSSLISYHVYYVETPHSIFYCSIINNITNNT